MLRGTKPRLVILAALFLTFWSSAADAQWAEDGIPVCTAGANQESPRIVNDAAGGVIITWVDWRTGKADIYAHHILAAGTADPTWPPNGRALYTASNSSPLELPAIVSDGAGGAIVTWGDWRNGANTDIYAQHVLASGAVDPAWPVDGRAVCTAASAQASPTIVSDGAGGAVVAWTDFRSGVGQVYAQHVLASGAVDAAWPANGLRIYPNGQTQGSPAILSDGAGGVLIVWSDWRTGLIGYSDIYAQHVLAAGTLDPVWPPDGAALCTAGDRQEEPVIVSDGAGGAIVAWLDYRNGGITDVYVQRVASSGVVDAAWPADGRAVCAAPNWQVNGAIVSDGAGGAVVAWMDFRDGRGNGRAYAQRVVSSGVVDPAWPGNGRALCASAVNQEYGGEKPTIVSDGTGGAVVTWSDHRLGIYRDDIYAQRVLSSGVVDPAWPADGRAVCAASDIQHHPASLSDGAGGAIVAWMDFRGGLGDIYAQRVSASGGVAAADVDGVQGIDLQPPYPNPTHSKTTVTFHLGIPQRVSAGVYDVTGHLVHVLAHDREFSAGPQGLTWDGTIKGGSPASTGIYFVRVSVAGTMTTRRVAMLR